MKKLFILTLTLFAMSFTTLTLTKSLHDFKVKALDGTDFDLSSLKGKKVMIVNTASECGYTPQYKDLEALYEKYKDKNFVILGFPCNDFGGQEPGSSKDIQTFCTKNYGVTFPMMEKVSIVNNPAPIYKWLTTKAENGVLDATVKWNFNKFLVDENGHLVKYCPSGTLPMSDEIVKWIEGK
ncbi:MAG: glutathione peroxidase [Bacteroidetes bacterium]|nr:glutathione peroxidase [Bacteroidota bacterium]